jgi:hypothetical protein
MVSGGLDWSLKMVGKARFCTIVAVKGYQPQILTLTIRTYIFHPFLPLYQTVHMKFMSTNSEYVDIFL